MAPRILERVIADWVKKDTWPPPDVRERWATIAAYRMRYDNDRQQLISSDPRIMADSHRAEIFTPIPWARELCRFSAALLFSETPQITSAPANEEAINNLIEVNDLGAFAIKGGVQVAKEGRCGIRVVKDPAISTKSALLTLIDEDQILWDIRHGAFYCGGIVVITRKPDSDTEKRITYRLLEEHTAGLVRRRLFKGHDHELGKEVPLTALDEFASLTPDEATGLDKPTLIPWENIPGGESDLFGLGPMLDQANESESLLLDRARKSIPRVFVDRTMADGTGRLAIEGYIFTGGARTRLPLGQSPSSTIEVVQPNFMAEEHIKWVDHINQMLVTLAGYSPLTWGIQGQTANVTRAVSGYAMKLSQLRTLLTRSAKEHMALQAIGWAVATAIAWEAEDSDVSNFLPDIELGDGLPADPLDGAQEVLYLRQAMAASTETLISTIHPTWSPEAVEQEAQLITDQGMFPQNGLGPGGGSPLPRSIKDLADAATRERQRAGAGDDPAPGPG